MGDDRLIDLTDQRDAYHFAPGMRVELAMADDGSLRPMTAWERLVSRIRRRLRQATRWWRPRSVVACVDTQVGTIGVRIERWSWRRWRWE